jgi:diadenosine tetraphosphate (Ap4A) HIT family hydrolase
MGMLDCSLTLTEINNYLSINFRFPSLPTYKFVFPNSPVMTMIACTLNKAMPVLIGDLLISSSQKPPAFELPVLTDDVVQYLSSEASDHPIRLDQKIYVLKENVCIAFAGDVADIKKFLIDITIYCKAKEEITTLDMQQFLQQHVGSDTWKEISFVILVAERLRDEIGIGKFLHGQWLKADTELYGEVWATGSGAEDFLIEASVKMDFSGNYEPDDAEHVIQANLIMICRLLAQERKTLNSVKNHWGAGFEMIYYDGRQFKKVDEITYVINYGKYTDAGGIRQVPIPAIILHYKYFGELLVISVIRAFSGNTIENDTTYTIEDKFPVTDGHCLIIPKRHFPEYFEITQPELNALNSLIKQAKQSLIKKDGFITGFNVGINSGIDAGQTIMHTHIHLIPRRKNDVAVPRGGIRNLILGKGAY